MQNFDSNQKLKIRALIFYVSPVFPDDFDFSLVFPELHFFLEKSNHNKD